MLQTIKKTLSITGEITPTQPRRRGWCQNLFSLNLLPTGVVQIPAAVGSLGRLGPMLLTVLTRKRRVAQPGRANETDVTSGFVTL